LIEDEIKDQQRKNRRTATDDTHDSTMLITRIASRLVVPPEAQWIKVWDGLRTLTVLYYVFEVPVHFCFLSKHGHEAAASSVWLTANIVADLFMSMNVVLTFFRAFVNDTKVVTSFTDIRTHYVFGYFVWDAVACLPIDLIASPTDGDSGLLARPCCTCGTSSRRSPLPQTPRAAS